MYNSYRDTMTTGKFPYETHLSLSKFQVVLSKIIIYFTRKPNTQCYVLQIALLARFQAVNRKLAIAVCKPMIVTQFQFMEANMCHWAGKNSLLKPNEYFIKISTISKQIKHASQSSLCSGFPQEKTQTTTPMCKHSFLSALSSEGCKHLTIELWYNHKLCEDHL